MEKPDFQPPELAAHLRTLTDAALESRLGIVQSQIPHAFKARATDELERLVLDERLIVEERVQRLERTEEPRERHAPRR